MKKVSFLGVIIGGITDIVSTGVFAVPFMVFVLVAYVPHVPPNQAQSALTSAINGNHLLSILQWLPGIAGSLFAGYVAAWIAKHDEALNGALSSWLCILLGIYSLVTAKVPILAYEHVIALVGSPVTGLVGGWLRLAQTRAKTAPVNGAI